MNDKELLIELRKRREALQEKAKSLNDDMAALERTIAAIERTGDPFTHAAGPGPGHCAASGHVFATNPLPTPTFKGTQAILTHGSGAIFNGVRCRTCTDAILASLRLRPKETHTTDSLLESAAKFYPGICRKQVGRAIHSMKVGGMVKAAGRGLFILANSNPPTSAKSAPPPAPANPAPATKEAHDELRQAVDLEHRKQRLGTPGHAAVPADPELLAKKRSME